MVGKKILALWSVLRIIVLGTRETHMTYATSTLELYWSKAHPGRYDYEALLNGLNASSAEVDQDWETGETVWQFEDESAIKVSENDVHVYGTMPNSIETGWYFAGCAS